MKLLSGGKVLVVDDEADLREFLCADLSEQGADLDSASNGRDAYKKVEHRFYDVVVTDARMPEGDGLEFIRRLKAMPCSPQVLLLSGCSNLDAEEVLRHGADAYMSKPFRVKELHEKIQKLMALRSIRAA